jgi:lipopolysaccharide export system permease protein
VLSSNASVSYARIVKTLHLYLLRQVLATLLMTVLVFTFMLLLGNALREIIALLINRQATLSGVFEAVGLLIPFVLAFALPMGMLTASLLVFGRFSADQELTAVRASGISLVALVTPILILSLLLCGVSAWINMDVAPHCRNAYKSLLDQMGRKMSTAILPEGRFDSDFKPFTFYIGRNDGKNLHDVYVYSENTNHVVDRTIRADRGEVEITNQQVTIILFNAHEIFIDPDTGLLSPGEQARVTLTINPSKTGNQINLSDMTFRQLRQELKKLEQKLSVATSQKLTGEELRQQKKEWEQLKSNVTMPVLIQIHRQIASSFACFGFTLIGIPLGIRAHRKETNIGIAMALGLVLIYYGFVILGQSLQTHPEFVPQLIFWLPNFIFEIVGAVMLWRANRGI